MNAEDICELLSGEDIFLAVCILKQLRNPELLGKTEVLVTGREVKELPR